MNEQNQIEELLRQKLKEWEYDPVKFVYEGLGFINRMKDLPEQKPTPQQVNLLRAAGEILRAKVKRDRGEKLTPEEARLAKKTGISVRSGQGNGKTTAASWLVIWFLICHHDALCPCMAPKAAQLQTTLFKEIGVWIAQMNKYGHLLCRDKLEVQSNRIYHVEYSESKDKWAAIPKIASESGSEMEKGAKMRGDHAQWMMVMAEEAAGMEDNAMQTMEGTLKSPNFMVIIFNPIKTSGFAYDTHHKNKQDWMCMHWSAEESALTDPNRIEKAARTYGRESNYFRVNVLGEFPVISENEFIPLHLIEEAFEREEITTDPNASLILGVDPARLGKDRTAIFERRGNVFGPIREEHKLDNVEVAEKLHMIHRTHKSSAIVIDTNGVGAGVFDVGRRFRLPVYSVMSQSKAKDHKRFNRLRDELLFGLRDWFFNHRIIINLHHPDIPEERVAVLEEELKEELRTLEYQILESGKIKFISKDDIKKKIGRSPDLLDALVLSMYYDDVLFRNNNKSRRDPWETVANNATQGWMSY